jgi:lauroyl/myristoyl acyltransferase
MMARSIRRVKPRLRLYVLRYRIGEYSLRGFIALLPYIPFRLVESLHPFLAWATYTVSRGYRQRMEDNLTAALGKEIPRAEDRKALVKRAVAQLCSWRARYRGGDPLFQTGRHR